jgi:hypothetical protein
MRKTSLEQDVSHSKQKSYSEGLIRSVLRCKIRFGKQIDNKIGNRKTIIK